jgi:hypothetical protein
MKRNILLLIGILGLVALEYGCQEEPISCASSSEMSITGINTLEYLEVDSANQFTELSNDQVPYFNLRYRIVLDWESIAGLVYSNYSAYAVTAPFTRWTPDSIQVLENANDVTKLFTVDGYSNIPEYLEDSQNQYGNYLYLKMLNAPEKEANRTFTFKIYNGEDRWQINSKPIVITP